MSQRNNKRYGKTSAPKKSGWAIPICAVLIFTSLSVMGFALKSRDAADSASGGGNVQEPAQGENLVIPLGGISGTAQFYPVTVDGTKMEVLAVEAPDGTIRTAFNTCEVCYGSGKGYYVQQGDALVCQNCGNRFPMSRVGVEAGGCNPWPILDGDKSATDGSITISYDFLKESKGIFANWRTSY